MAPNLSKKLLSQRERIIPAGKKVFKNGTALIYRRQTTILSAAFVLAVLMLASRILGLVRWRILAAIFGPGKELDVYIAAFSWPDTIFQLLVMGALSSAFIPIFTDYVIKGEKKTASLIASSILNLSLIIAFILMFALFVVVNISPSILAPGFSQTQLEDFRGLVNVMLLAQPFLVVSGFLTSILQSYQRFLLPALAATLYNVGIIIGSIWFTPFLGIYGPAWGVILGAVFFLVAQLPLIRNLKIDFSLGADLNHPGVRTVGKLSLPRTLGIAVGQIDAKVDLILATLLSVGSVSVFVFANSLQSFPVSIFGYAIAIASLPTLSIEYSQKKLGDFKQTLLSSLNQIFFLVVPMAVIFMVLRVPVVRLVYGVGKFGWEDTLSTATTLSFFAIGLFAQAGILLLARAFYALQDTMTPVKAALIAVAFNIVISVTAVYLFAKVEVLGLTSSISAILNFLILLKMIDRKIDIFAQSNFLSSVLKTFSASLIMGIFLYSATHIKIEGRYLLDLLTDTTRTINLLLSISIITLVGLAIYVLLAWSLKSEELKMFKVVLEKAKNIRKILVVEESNV